MNFHISLSQYGTVLALFPGIFFFGGRVWECTYMYICMASQTCKLTFCRDRMVSVALVTDSSMPFILACTTPNSCWSCVFPVLLLLNSVALSDSSRRRETSSLSSSRLRESAESNFACRLVVSVWACPRIFSI